MTSLLHRSAGRGLTPRLVSRKRAVAEFVSRHSPDQVTESFDRVCAELDDGPDPAFQSAARRVLEKSEW